jgi:competence protein ComEA
MTREKSGIIPVASKSPVAHQQPPGISSGAPGSLDELLADAETLKLPAVTAPSRFRRWRQLRLPVILLLLLMAGAIYCLWQGLLPGEASPALLLTPTVATPSARHASPHDASSATAEPAASPGGTIQVYVVGAVKHPGVYSLPPGARVYQLLQAAGGPLPGADLVALNLAAPLSDGEEVYVRTVDERPPLAAAGVSSDPSSTSPAGATPTPVGGAVNINTASADELRQRLHVSAKTAQNIVNYRNEHGPYSSVDQLLQVVSRSIYDRIRNLVTV